MRGLLILALAWLIGGPAFAQTSASPDSRLRGGNVVTKSGTNVLTGTTTFAPVPTPLPVALSWQAPPSTSPGVSNVAGANWTFKGSQGTGTGAGGQLVFQTSPAGGSGSAQNAEVTAFYVDPTGQLVLMPASINQPIRAVNGATYGSTNGIAFWSTLNSSAPGPLWAAGFTVVNVWGGQDQFDTDVRLKTSGLDLQSSAAITFYSGILNGGTNDTILRRRVAATFAFGAADAASAVAQGITVQNVVAGTSNTAGANFTVGGSQGTGTGVGGSLLFQTAPPGTTGTAQNALQTVAQFDGNAHVKFGGAAPAVSSCGTGSPAVSGTDEAGEITIGTTATACTLTFKIAYAAAPVCTISDRSVTADVTSYTISTTTFVLTMTSNSGDKVDYICHGA